MNARGRRKACLKYLVTKSPEIFKSALPNKQFRRHSTGLSHREYAYANHRARAILIPDLEASIEKDKLRRRGL